jgi:uncharacterized protein
MKKSSSLKTPSAVSGLSPYTEYRRCVKDLLAAPDVLSMEGFVQHGSVTCLQHCLQVSYRSYHLCKRLGLDYRSAARGGLLHDMFLYDWHEPDSHHGLHAFSHPAAALKNARAVLELNPVESDIIRKHMWPLTARFPRYWETFIVSCMDKYCAVLEVKDAVRMTLYTRRQMAG